MLEKNKMKKLSDEVTQLFEDYLKASNLLSSFFGDNNKNKRDGIEINLKIVTPLLRKVHSM
jgi:hypothetical protein